MNLAKISSNGQITVPAETRRLLGLKSGDAVLFKRGDTFRTASTISMVSGVTYSAYGSGAKPKIYGSIKHYADKSIWSTSDGNIWSTSLNATYADNAVFNNGESVGVRKSSLGDLKQNGDFYYNKSGKKFYLFLNQINPGTRFNSIEIASSEYLFHGWGSSTNKVTNAQIINLDLKYAAVHAIALGFVENITVQKCVIGWSGGGYQNGARLGNAIQLWRYAKTGVGFHLQRVQRIRQGRRLRAFFPRHLLHDAIGRQYLLPHSLRNLFI